MSVARDFDTIDDLDLDPAVRPQDDLFGHVNGNWVERTEIPDDRATHGSFAILNDMSEEQVRTIITDAAEGRITGEEATKIGDLYASFVDEETVEALGVTPLQSTWARIADVADTDGLVALMGQLAREGVGGVVSLSPWIDRGNPERYLLHLAQSGLGLPDESYYRLDEHAEIRSAYVGHVERMMALATDHGLAPIGDGDPAAVANDVMALEARLAAAHWDRTATRDAVKTYNLVDADGLTGLLPTAPTWLTAMGLAESQWAEVVVGQPDVLEAVSTALDEVDLVVWQRWLAWRVLRGTASYLSSPFVDERFDFTGRILTGAKELKERWKRGVATVQGVMGEAVGKLYVERHYPPEAEAQMAELVDNLLKAYEARISTLDWMAEETRKEALAKLATFRPKIGRPVK